MPPAPIAFWTTYSRDRAAGPVGDRFPQQRAGRRHERRQAIDDTLLFVGEQQRFHFASEIGVAAAARVQERAALLRGAFDCVAEDVLNERPAIRCRGVAHVSSSGSRVQLAIQPRSSGGPLTFDRRRRHLSASAVSSTVIPP